ncbi:DUF1553 domain-containing protein [Pareuzebyella sediminis]|uniref:DUF1553 domain-containing protein n=1 Tax=Pareuzebyella sediminis TaxID=2607998 RepID=UPI0018E14D23|nr:DUF1553 domain-containing protein [Pareuzebyella sediminis]
MDVYLMVMKSALIDQIKMGVAFCGLFMAIGCGWEAPPELREAMTDVPDAIDFNYHVKPILSDKCFACHGPDEASRKAGLRLDIAENAYKAIEATGHHAIVPGKPEHSELVARILSDDPETKMPPPEFKVDMTLKEKAILAKWVAQGAIYKPHWAYIKPEKKVVPEVASTKWAKNEIDYFVQKKLEAQRLKPSERASKEALIRRLSFDVTGLPPTLQEIEAYLSDNSVDAYEKIVDRLMASPAYGERMAADWMDVARYADSDGYLDDKHRDFSPYRDWVIKTFNGNMPYDQFVTWQLAGDLIENATQESRLATAFNRLHKRNSEAGIVFEEYRVEYVADRTLSLGKAFLGLSVECARCHDHKYDAISQKDYYELFAFFNSTNELGSAVYGPGQVPGPSLLLTNDEQDKVLAYIDSNIDRAKKELATVEGNAHRNSEFGNSKADVVKRELQERMNTGLVAQFHFDRFRSQGTNLFHTPDRVGKPSLVKEPVLKKRNQGNAVFFNDYTAISLPEKVGWFDQTDPFTISLDVYPGKNYEDSAVFTHCEGIRLGLKGYSGYLENGHFKFVIARSWPTNALQVRTKSPIPIKEWSSLTVSYDGLGKASGIHVYLNGKEVPVTIEIDNLYKSILFEKNEHNYAFLGFTMGYRDKFKTLKDGGIDNLSIYERALSPLEILYHVDPDGAIDKIEQGQLSDYLEDFHNAGMNSKAAKVKEEIRELRRKKHTALEPVKEIMVLGDLEEPRPTYILDRGMYDAPSEQVWPDVPEAIFPFDKNLPKNRLGLSKWLMDRNNPLTARVFVNRLWQMYFGRGLVETSDDFGSQGSLPSHPDLLDWLAVDFMDSGWDIKHLQKQIVMSAAYQQSSEIREELQQIDSDNVLLARGPIKRMSAEMVRDNALAISGLLSPKIGGPSQYPYQPEGLWDEISNKSWRYRYKQEPGEGLYRRSLYTIWKRSSAPPSMMIFDAGDRSVCSVKRRQTSTPLQALVLLNDPQYIEASYVLAENLIHSQEESRQELLQKAFQICTGRAPQSDELKVLFKFFEAEHARFEAQKEGALAYLNMGETKIKEDSDPIQVAALATVINGIMNTSEGYTIR